MQKLEQNELTKTTQTLKEIGYSIVEVHNPKKYSFNLVAKRENKILIIRFFKNIDSCRRNIAIELKKLAYGLKGIPFIIGLYTRCNPLVNGILYKRFGIFATNPITFEEIAKGKRPVVYAERGGFFVKINGKKLRKIREKRGLSLGQLAEEIGVSRRTIYGYEREEIEATPEIAAKLEKVLGETIIKPIDISSVYNEIEQEVSSLREEFKDPLMKKVQLKASRYGFSITILRKAPFEIIAIKRDEGKRYLIKTIKKSQNISEIKREVIVGMKIANISQTDMVLLSEDEKIKKLFEGLPSSVKLVDVGEIQEIFQ